MKQLTIRVADAELERRIVDLAEEEGLSINQVAVRLLAKGAGLWGEKQPTSTIGDSLDDLTGTWTEAEETSFLESTAIFEMIDEELWQ